ncbi:MAG: response regulator [Desulfobacterales bacterium]|nr:response regulator [Desulfobacterales bacterium]
MINTQNKHGDQHEIPPQILVMEDDLNVAEGLEMVLTEEGYDVYLAGTGKLAREAFKRGRYDLLVADIRLPDINGIEIIREIKETKPETEVIAISGYATTATAVEAMKLGVHDFLPKPFTEAEIKSTVSEALKEHQGKPAVKPAATQEEKLIQKRQVIEVLNRTTDDEDFWMNLMENGSLALGNYTLSTEAKAAIASGDLRWINQNIGELTQKQLMFIYKRLEREAW